MSEQVMKKRSAYWRDVRERIKEDILEYRWLALAIAAYYLITKMMFHAFCPMVIITGLPCPGCGMTRAALFFLTGQFERSLSLTPFILAWAVIGVYAAIMRYLAGKKSKILMPLIYLTIIGMFLFYIYRMATQFPGDPPISYTGNNFLERLIPGYRSFVLGLFE